MQYAEIIIKQKVHPWDATYSYTIPPEILSTISVGSLVSVPFGKQETEGVILKLRSTVPKALQTKLKPITKNLQPEYRVSPVQFNFTRWLAEKYFSTWGEALFAAIPPIPRRPLKNQSIPEIKTAGHQHHDLLLLPDLPRFEQYLKYIEKTIQASETAYLIFSDNLRLERFKTLFADRIIQIPHFDYTAKDNTTTRWTAWQQIQSSQPKLILGSRLALLTPCPNTGLIIIDEPNHSGHQEEQSPRYFTREVGKYWSKLFQATLLEGDLFPSSEQLNEIKHGKTKLVIPHLPSPSCQIQLADLSIQKPPISHELEMALHSTLADKKSVLLFTTSKGYGGATICTDCGHVLNCPDCLIPMLHPANSHELRCHHCQSTLVIPSHCPRCRSARFKSLGWGTENLHKYLTTIIDPAVPIITIDKDNPPADFPARAIYIATQAIFRYPLQPTLTGIIRADQLLSRPDFSTNEQALRTIFHLAMMTRQKLIIQTENPNIPLLQAIRNKKFASVFQSILRERKTYQYPPYGHLVKLIVEDAKDATAEKKVNSLAKKIACANPAWQILGPSPVYAFKSGHLHRWQLIIKSAQPISPNALRPLISGEVWIQIDPPTLL